MTLDINVYLNSIMDKKPENLIFLDLTELDAVADFFIICHGKTTRQVIAMAEYVKSDLKKHNIQTMGYEGSKEGHWIVLDYGRVVIHIFHESFRQFYNLEGLWSDAKIFKINKNKNEIADSVGFYSSNSHVTFESILID